MNLPIPTLSIVIVSYNCKTLLLKCLESINAHVQTLHETIVVDSGSADGSAEAVQLIWPDTYLIACKENIGFVRGNNQGFAVSKGRYVLMLNPDTIITDGSLDDAIQFMEKTTNCAGAGLQLLGKDGTPQLSCQTFPSVYAELRKCAGWLWPMRSCPKKVACETGPHKTDWVCGACLLIRRSAMENIGMLDAQFFMYYEEVDWCRRATTCNWEIWMLPQLRIVHFGGQSALASGEVLLGGNISRHFKRSRRLYFRKHLGIAAAAIVEAAHVVHGCGASLRRIGQLWRANNRRHTLTTEVNA